MVKKKEKTTARTTIKSGIETALQGLAFWISYEQILHGKHPLNIGENALVTEFVNLLKTKLNNEFKISREKQCEPSRKKLMDVEIKKGDLRVAAIEFKRISAGKAAIQEDMKKLLELKTKNVSCFLVVVSENKRPTKYVNKDGKAITGNLVQKGNFSAYVKRVLKSTASFGKGEKGLPRANYCCLIEI